MLRLLFALIIFIYNCQSFAVIHINNKEAIDDLVHDAVIDPIGISPSSGLELLLRT